MTDRTFTLPELASLVDVEYRTLHTWVSRGLLSGSRKQAQGSGTRNLFDSSEALEAYVLADLRRAGLALTKLEQVAAALRNSRKRRTGTGDVLVINGAVQMSHYDKLTDVVSRTSPTLVYDLAHACAGLTDRLESTV
jgi:DNA-binding transcriptional MerR regulator